MSSAANEGYAGTDQASRLRSKTTEHSSGTHDVGQSTVDQVRQQTASYADAAKRSAEDVAERTAEFGRRASNSVQEVGSHFREAVERSVERQPMTTILLAMAAGVILGGLMRR